MENIANTREAIFDRVSSHAGKSSYYKEYRGYGLNILVDNRDVRLCTGKIMHRHQELYVVERHNLFALFEELMDYVDFHLEKGDGQAYLRDRAENPLEGRQFDMKPRDLGDLVHALRRLKGWTIEMVAEQSKIAPIVIEDLEAGRNVSIAQFLSVLNTLEYGITIS